MEQTGDTAPPEETTPLMGTRSEQRCGGCCCCQTLAVGLFTAFVIILVLAAVTVVSTLTIIGYPWHASCQADWTFGNSCPEVMTAIVDQMNAWSGPEGCASGGEKCLYQVTSTTDNMVTGTHTTPVSKYVDDIKFTFVNGTAGMCLMKGYSRSKTWYAYLDSGTNYCNMKNLVVGAGLDQGDPQYSEKTSDGICTQYSSADCTKY